MTEEARKLSHSEQQAVAQLESIKEMVAALECDYDRLEELRDERDDWEPPTDEEIEERAASGGTKLSMSWAEQNPDDAAELAELEKACTIDGQTFPDADAARERIQEDALSVQVRYGWITPGASEDMLKDGPEEFEILLCTGGPACRIIGDLDEHCQPTRARLQHQDWGTSWQDWIVTGSDYDALMTYCGCFYFGE